MKFKTIGVIGSLIIVFASFFTATASVSPTGEICTTAFCASCELHESFYSGSCPEMVEWCSTPDFCPGGLEPLVCAGNPPFSRCVHVGLTACDESNSLSCCADQDLGIEWYCKVPSDCPPSSNPCLVPNCMPIGGAPNPYNYPDKCVYDALPDGITCKLEGGAVGTCTLGVCSP